ncbi:MAG TPA: glycogen synthase GlgA [Bryobacteraceae bacterium]|nr:glycogen synthase GlgA [Bryobacteraceae bacterium]
MAKILMVASEAAPYAKTGGLADVLSALPKALVRAGEEVAVVLPYYRNTPVSSARPIYERLAFGLGPFRYAANILARLDGGVRYLFVQIPELYDRPGLYGESDDHLRFAALCQSALGIARHLFMPNVIHGHDWQAGLLPVFLKDTYANHPSYLGLKTILTIHNLGYQGQFPIGALADLGLPRRLYDSGVLEFHGGINFLKAGLVMSDRLTTVSPRYAREIQTPQFGFGLDGLLRRRSDVLTGILNGADYGRWDPATDPLIPAHFHRGDLAGKAVCKRTLLAEAGLSDTRASKPLIGVVSRFASQKGFDLLMQIPHEVAAADVTLVVVGSGDQRYEDFFRWYQSAYPDRVSVRFGYDDHFAHLIEAGSDMFLMPSRYEPCGLNQIYSMRYGTLPLVHATGGLDDTVDGDTGFKFWGFTPGELLECIRAALRVYGTDRWEAMVVSAMRRDFSWEAAAQKYLALYRNLMATS